MALSFLCQDLLVEITVRKMKCFDQRSNNRFELKNGVVLTPDRVCQVINLSKGGFALKCFSELVFPPEWTMDIYDATGLNLQELRVKKVWEKKLNKVCLSQHSQVEAGWILANHKYYAVCTAWDRCHTHAFPLLLV